MGHRGYTDHRITDLHILALFCGILKKNNKHFLIVKISFTGVAFVSQAH